MALSVMTGINALAPGSFLHPKPNSTCVSVLNHQGPPAIVLTGDASSPEGETDKNLANRYIRGA